MDFECIVLEQMAQSKHTGGSFGPTVVYLEEQPVWGNEVLRPEMAAFLDERQRDNKSLSLCLDELSSLNCNRLTTDDFYSGSGRVFTQPSKGMSAHL